MGRLSTVVYSSRAVLDRLGNPRRGLFGAFLAVAIRRVAGIAGGWCYWAHRISQPIRELTTGLSEWRRQSGIPSNASRATKSARL